MQSKPSSCHPERSVCVVEVCVVEVRKRSKPRCESTAGISNKILLSFYKTYKKRLNRLLQLNLSIITHQSSLNVRYICRKTYLAKSLSDLTITYSILYVLPASSVILVGLVSCFTPFIQSSHFSFSTRFSSS